MPRWNYDSAHEQVWSNIRMGPDHWCWTGYCMPDGSPQVRINGHSVLVRRFVWEETNGPIQKGTYLRRDCDETRCIRPAHYHTSTSNTKAPEPLKERIHRKTAYNDYDWLWTGQVNDNGYGVIYRPGRGPDRVHRIAWELASGQSVPDGMNICHTCDVRLCVRNEPQGTYVVNGVEITCYGHLFLCTYQQNSDDATQKGRQTRGRNKGSPWITPPGERDARQITAADVTAIRAAVAVGQRQADVARLYGLDPRTVNDFVRRKSWRHVP